MNIFNPNRLKFARKRRGITLVSFASALNITSKTLSAYENGRSDPNDTTIISMAEFLNFPKDFFFREDIAELEKTTVSFRSLARMPAYVRDSALCAGQIALEFSSLLDKKFSLPVANLPDLRGYTPEAASEIIRSELAIGERSISSMVHLLESKGIRVFSLVEETYDMDAFSFWMGKYPFIFLNTKKSVERSRFDAAHELGHILLHKHGSPLGKEAETQANRFASALLMPQGSVIANLPRFVTLDNIIRLKSIWRVSASSLARRMKDLGLLTEWLYRSIMVEISKRGYMKCEPNAIKQPETSKLLPMIFNALREEGITKYHIAKELGLFVNEIDSLIFNLTITGIDSGVKKTFSIQDKSKKTNHLKIIK